MSPILWRFIYFEFWKSSIDWLILLSESWLQFLKYYKKRFLNYGIQ